MSTVADYRVAVRAKGYDSATDAITDAAVHEARTAVALERRWSFALAQNVALSTAAGVQSVSLTGLTDLGDIDAVRLRTGTTDYDLDNDEVQDLRDLQTDVVTTARGIPERWTQRASDLLFYPTPNAVYTLLIDYVKTPSDLGSTSGTIDTFFPDRMRHLIAWRAAQAIAYRQRDSWVTTAEATYLRELRKFAGKDAIKSRADSDQVKPFWGTRYYGR
jgi:hypothetical protein